MKNRLSFLLMTSAIVGLLAMACKKQENTATDTSDTTLTSTNTTDTTVTTAATDTTATGTAAMTSTAPLNDADKNFVMKAAQGGMAEVTLGQLAAAKGTHPDVQAFGNRMVSDHGKANTELTQFAMAKGVTMPTELDAEGKKSTNDLSKVSGKDFDKAYIKDMVADHEKDVAEFEKASKSVTDPDLKNWVTKTLPTLQDHLKMAKETAGKLK